NLSQNEVHSDPDLILYNPSVLIDKEPKKTARRKNKILSSSCFLVLFLRTQKTADNHCPQFK
ncbi:hypothetical protein ACNPMA_04830, partial [Enterococcus faecium]